MSGAMSDAGDAYEPAVGSTSSGTRDDAGVDGEIHRSEPAPTQPGTQDGPLLDMHDTTLTDQINGILAQTRADLGEESTDRYAEVLRQRFADTGIEVPDDRITSLAERASGGADSGDGAAAPDGTGSL